MVRCPPEGRSSHRPKKQRLHPAAAVLNARHVAQGGAEKVHALSERVSEDKKKKKKKRKKEQKKKEKKKVHRAILALSAASKPPQPPCCVRVLTEKAQAQEAQQA